MEPSSLAPSLLLAMPQMRDPNFVQSVVLLCEHSNEGTMGLVVNRPTTTAVTSIVRLDPPPDGGSEQTVWIGGPVETTRAWILSSFDLSTSDRIALGNGLFLGAS